MITIDFGNDWVTVGITWTSAWMNASTKSDRWEKTMEYGGNGDELTD